MKYVLNFFLLLLSSSIFCSLSSDQELFDKAKLFYNQQEWNQAKEDFSAIKQKGSSVWFNLGSCYYNLNEYPQALACWKKAQKGATIKEYLYCNKAIEMIKGSKNMKTSSWHELYHFWPFSLMMLQLCFLSGWYGTCWSINRSRRKKWLTIFLGIFTLILSTILLAAYVNGKRKYGVILKDTTVFIGPNEQFHKKGTVTKCDYVSIKAYKPGWYKISFQNNHAWINKDFMAVI